MRGRQRHGADAQPRKRPARALLDGLLHTQGDAGRTWRLLPPMLALAFAVRAAIALAGDFVLHPDEIMQYLEPAHRLAFGNGIVYWEYFYGARSWLVPGAVAGVLRLFDAFGLGQPWWYVDGVKLAFCALSLAIPAGMYQFARRHFGEASARIALVAGAFWYELAALAHKPLTEFVAAAPLAGLLALCVHPEPDRPRVCWQAAVLAVLASAIRLQYAPVALLLLGIAFLRTRLKLLLAASAAVAFAAVGVFDGLVWDGGLFHSYVTNVRFNLILGDLRSGESPAHQFLWWLTVAGGGLSLLCLAGAWHAPKRYGLLLALIVVVVLAHSLQSHKEYRFIFVVTPLWLLIGADLAVRVQRRLATRTATGPLALPWAIGAAATLFAAVSAMGVLNALPYQARVYQAWSRETGVTGFLRAQDPIFSAYRYLARSPDVAAVWQVDRPYFNLPGYYYLHRPIPFYDAFTGRAVAGSLAALSASVSHLVSADPELTVAGFSPDRDFGGVRVLRRDAAEPMVRQWQDHAPVIVDDLTQRIMRQVDGRAPTPPSDAGIRFAQPR